MASPTSPIDPHAAVLHWRLDAIERPSRSERIASVSRSILNPAGSSDARALPAATAFALSSVGFLAPLALISSPSALLISLPLAALPQAAAVLGRSAELASRLAPSAAQSELSRSGSRLAAFGAAARAAARSLQARSSPAWRNAYLDASVSIQSAALHAVSGVADLLPGPAAKRVSQSANDARDRALKRHFSSLNDEEWTTGRAVRALSLAHPDQAAAALYQDLALDRLQRRSKASLPQLAQCKTGLLTDRERSARKAIQRAALLIPDSSASCELESVLDIVERLALNPLYRPRADLPSLLELIETQGDHRPGVWQIQSPYVIPRLEALRATGDSIALAAVVGDARPVAAPSRRPMAL